MSELHFALAEELERLAAGYRALAKGELDPDVNGHLKMHIFGHEKCTGS
jgi:hypothetical protein